MRFGFDDEQIALRETVRDFLRNNTGDVWDRLTGELGLTALAVAEEHGGFGASLVEAGIALEEAGAVLLSAPLLSTVTAAAALDPGCPAAAELLPRLAGGSVRAALALTGDHTLEPGPRLTGVAEHVLDGDVADLFVVAAGGGLYAVTEADVQPRTPLDQTRGQARVVFEHAPARLVAADARPAGDLLHATLAIESIGVARTSLQSTVEYLRTREQFGVPLATFQALRHRVADLAVAFEQATSTTWYALRVAGTDEFAVAAPMAKLVATEAAYAITAAGIQLAGGIGFTWEHPAHRYFKRATANRLLAGDPTALRRLIGARINL
jgi:alkylation response protein AidB-like acyl-CoA dehydrogenase